MGIIKKFFFAASTENRWIGKIVCYVSQTASNIVAPESILCGMITRIERKCLQTKPGLNGFIVLVYTIYYRVFLCECVCAHNRENGCLTVSHFAGKAYNLLARYDDLIIRNQPFLSVMTDRSLTLPHSAINVMRLNLSMSM